MQSKNKIFIAFFFLILPAISYASISASLLSPTQLLITPIDPVNYGSAICIVGAGLAQDCSDFRYDGYSPGSENSDPYIASAFPPDDYFFVEAPKNYFICIDTLGTGGMGDYQTVCSGLGYNGATPETLHAITNGTTWTYSPPSSVNPSIASFHVLTATNSSDMIAGVASGVNVTGGTLWVIVALALSIPLTFYVIVRVKDIFNEVQFKK